MAKQSLKDDWRDVEYMAKGRARPLGLSEEGALDWFVLEREDGSLEIKEPTDASDIWWPNDRYRHEVEIPVRELAELRHGEFKHWSGPEMWPAKLVGSYHDTVAIEFDEPLPDELVDQMGLFNKVENADG